MFTFKMICQIVPISTHFTTELATDIIYLNVIVIIESIENHWHLGKGFKIKRMTARKKVEHKCIRREKVFRNRKGLKCLMKYHTGVKLTSAVPLTQRRKFA